jgi:hypothetical protein
MNELGPRPALFSLYPTECITAVRFLNGAEDGTFDPTLIPFAVTADVSIEDVSYWMASDSEGFRVVCEYGATRSCSLIARVCHGVHPGFLESLLGRGGTSSN